jgi:hypothetical protein
MAWKRSSVRSRPGPPTTPPDACSLHSPEREHGQVLHRVRQGCNRPIGGTPAWPNHFHAGSRTLGIGSSRRVRYSRRSTAARATAEELEVASFDSRADTSFESGLARPGLPGRSSVRSRPGPPILQQLSGPASSRMAGNLKTKQPERPTTPFGVTRTIFSGFEPFRRIWTRTGAHFKHEVRITNQRVRICC